MVPPIIRQFVALAERYEDAHERGDFIRSSKLSNELRDLSIRIETNWDSLGLAFVSLLESQSRGVRLWAASRVLRIDSSLAVPVLQELQQEKGAIAADAMGALFAWSRRP